MKVFQPATSYEIALPDDIVEDHDGRVASYWRPGSSVLLQLSSMSRFQGEQIPASARLQDLFKKNPVQWFPVEMKLQNFPGAFAAAQTRDKKGVTWIHAYLTTESVAIYAIVSGPAQELKRAADWALEAVRTLRLRPPLVN
jgi:hypothetical protein